MADTILTNEPDLLTPKDLERLLSLSSGHVRLLLRDGSLPGVKVGSRWYVPRTELEKFLEKQLEEVMA